MDWAESDSVVDDSACIINEHLEDTRLVICETDTESNESSCRCSSNVKTSAICLVFNRIKQIILNGTREISKRNAYY